MKLIKPSFEILEQEFPVCKPDMSESQHKQALIDAMYKHIELCGRTCYKSTDKITEDSAKPFVDRMIASKHYAMLEHGTIYLRLLNGVGALNYINNPYSRVVWIYPTHVNPKRRGPAGHYITTNLRVLVENGWLDDLQYICCPTEYHAKRHTVRFICNRQVSHEFVRHRVFSFAQESTRYCNYTKDKFGNELTFIEPCWFSDSSKYLSSITPELVTEKCLQNIENSYFSLIENGWQPQQAATILPNAIKTELIMTGFEEDWKHFFDLRALGTTGAPHPQAKQLAEPLMHEFINRGYYEANTEVQDV